MQSVLCKAGQGVSSSGGSNMFIFIEKSEHIKIGEKATKMANKKDIADK
jgi:hypothetical protein